MSKLGYGLAVWGSCQGYLRRVLQVQQLTADCAVCGYRRYFWSTAKLLSTCGWLSVNGPSNDSKKILIGFTEYTDTLVQ